MIRILRVALFFVSLVCSGQDLSGRWEGPLKDQGTTLHVILDVERKPGGGWSAVFYNIDQTPQLFPVDSLTEEGSGIKLTIDSIRATYSGTLQTSGLTIIGEWKQPSSVALTLQRTGPTPTTALDQDHAFDLGSHLGTFSQLTPRQTENLVLLARTWGFLKYHHAVITSGQRHWDYELLRILPAVLNAKNRGAVHQVLLQWIHSLGPVPACHPCAQLDPSNLAVPPDLGWIRDHAELGEPLSCPRECRHDEATTLLL